ncbi:ArsO family NAD(P)H-dependent flavin-containing monooxygenase [Acetobacter pasteurianus]|uniref:Flavin-containing monooxygenase n=1 Tax=Acetobacter pasteurianus NBRC 3188 TaxID=1226663 RepID=A0A401WZM1_ACEPA|nr:ArsO family NAD(P)H-dependent flavin-containing monooxygenase [Acetobacter pasteurianus]GCD54630.1 flavin-containing monooxygenase [Acetobacter pasteurianus NBRC 3188]
MAEQFDVVIVGGGQAALAASYFLRRTGLTYVILDNGTQAGGAWVHGWDSLHLFSPASYSSLPGWPMPDTPDGSYPTRDEVLDYLHRYEARYAPPIHRPVMVGRVERTDQKFLNVRTSVGDFVSRAVIGATGTWSAPFIPDYPGRELFVRTQIHSSHYCNALPFAGQRLLVVGGGNSGAQIMAELSLVAQATWVTQHDPVFLPDDVDGRVLFERATARVLGGPSAMPTGGFGDIVMVPPVRAARERGVLHAVRQFVRMTATGVVWPDGREEAIDAIIWCTGFRPALSMFAPLDVIEPDGLIRVNGQQAVREPRLWLLGYGSWCGPASATLLGAGRVARSMVRQMAAWLASPAQGVRLPKP